ncbi:hypothetical protein HBB16_16180 [Pseudonocardia sp. MCCB 268]|nr:hypothetical protein [Pseudonocardia cytotoxica]
MDSTQQRDRRQGWPRVRGVPAVARRPALGELTAWSLAPDGTRAVEAEVARSCIDFLPTGACRSSRRRTARCCADPGGVCPGIADSVRGGHDAVERDRRRRARPGLREHRVRLPGRRVCAGDHRAGPPGRPVTRVADGLRSQRHGRHRTGPRCWWPSPTSSR